MESVKLNIKLPFIAAALWFTARGSALANTDAYAEVPLPWRNTYTDDPLLVRSARDSNGKGGIFPAVPQASYGEARAGIEAGIGA
jgi:hypothetical protein